MNYATDYAVNIIDFLRVCIVLAACAWVIIVALAWAAGRS